MFNRLTLAQIRGARGMLNWSILNLAKAAGVSVSTVKWMEMAGPQPLSDEIQATVQAAFEVAGVRLLDNQGRGDRVAAANGVGLQPRQELRQSIKCCEAIGSTSSAP